MTTTPTNAIYEYAPHAGDGYRARLDKRTWLAWTGRRWLNGLEYHGPVFALGSNVPITVHARVCTCDRCGGQTWRCFAQTTRGERCRNRQGLRWAADRLIYCHRHQPSPEAP